MKNVPDFELCKKLKDAGFPQPESRFGQFWYADLTGRVLVNLKNRPEKRPTDPFYEPKAQDLMDGRPSETRFVYAPTIPEMVANMPPVSYFTLSTATVENEANRCATIWLDFKKAENTPKATAVPTQADIMAALKFDAANTRPFYEAEKKRMADELGAQIEQRAEAFKKRFTPGNTILCHFGGVQRGKIFELLVLGRSPGEMYIKLQNEKGDVFWKERQDVYVVNILGNIYEEDLGFLVKKVADKFNIPPQNVQTCSDELGEARVDSREDLRWEGWRVARAMDATRQESNAEAILNCLKNIERLLETQKKPEMTPCKRFVAGDQIKPGECVYIRPDGAIMKS